MNLDFWLKRFDEINKKINSKVVKRNVEEKENLNRELKTIAVSIARHINENQEPFEPEIVGDVGKKQIKINLSKELKLC